MPVVMGHRRSSEPQTVTSHGFCFSVLNCFALSPHLGGTGRPGEPELVFPFPSVSSGLRGPREVSSGWPVSPSAAWLGRAKCSGASGVLLHGVILLGLLESSRTMGAPLGLGSQAPSQRACSAGVSPGVGLCPDRL